LKELIVIINLLKILILLSVGLGNVLAEPEFSSAQSKFVELAELDDINEESEALGNGFDLPVLILHLMPDCPKQTGSVLDAGYSYPRYHQDSGGSNGIRAPPIYFV
jgi:hypothetical protein